MPPRGGRRSPRRAPSLQPVARPSPPPAPSASGACALSSGTPGGASKAGGTERGAAPWRFSTLPRSPRPARSHKLFWPKSFHRTRDSTTTSRFRSSRPTAALGPASWAPVPTRDRRVSPGPPESALGADKRRSSPRSPQNNSQDRAGLASSYFVAAAACESETHGGACKRACFPPDFCPARGATVRRRARGRGSRAGGQACGERGSGCAAKGPGFGRRQLSSAAWLQTGPTRACAPASPGAVLRPRACGCSAEAPPLSLRPARPSDSQGFPANSPGLSRRAGQRVRPRERLQRGGEVQRPSPQAFGIIAPHGLPGA